MTNLFKAVDHLRNNLYPTVYAVSKSVVTKAADIGETGGELSFTSGHSLRYLFHFRPCMITGISTY